MKSTASPTTTRPRDLADSLLKSYQERNASLREELGLMAYRASLTGQYAEDEQGIVDLMVQRREQEAEAFAFMEKQKAAGMDAALALNGYIDNLLLIRQIHDSNLKLLQDQIAAARELAVQQAGEGASGMFSAAQLSFPPALTATPNRFNQRG